MARFCTYFQQDVWGVRERDIKDDSKIFGVKWKEEVAITEKRNQHLCWGHAKFEIPCRPPSGNARRILDINSVVQGKDPGWRTK